MDPVELVESGTDAAKNGLPLVRVLKSVKISLEFVAPTRQLLLTGFKGSIAQLDQPGFQSLGGSGKLGTLHTSRCQGHGRNLDRFCESKLDSDFYGFAVRQDLHGPAEYGTVAGEDALRLPATTLDPTNILGDVDARVP